MRFKLLTAALLAVALATAGARLASASSGGSSDDHGAQVISLFSTQDELALINVDQSPGSDATLGDELIVRDILFDHPGGTDVGSDASACTIVTVATDVLTFQCVATFVLTDRGQIAAQGIVALPAGEDETGFTFDFAVTSGTDDFQGAGGKVTTEVVNDKGDANVTFHLVE
jgi:hypothetical protein